MEENPQPKASLNVSIRKLCDSKLQCNRKQILEYIKNLNPDGNHNIILLLPLYNNVL